MGTKTFNHCGIRFGASRRRPLVHRTFLLVVGRAPTHHFINMSPATDTQLRTWIYSANIDTGRFHRHFLCFRNFSRIFMQNSVRDNKSGTKNQATFPNLPAELSVINVSSAYCQASMQETKSRLESTQVANNLPPKPQPPSIVMRWRSRIGPRRAGS